MLAQQFKQNQSDIPNPSDISHATIKDLFYRQIRSLSVVTRPRAVQKTVDETIKTFDLQFSDAWF